MKKAEIAVNQQVAGIFQEIEKGKIYRFDYLPEYSGLPVSLTLPVAGRSFSFSEFPAFLEGLLPEGIMLEGMLKRLKIDRDDYFSQLAAVGDDLVGALTFNLMMNDEL